MRGKETPPERVWITWDDAYPWPTPGMGGDEYARADLLATIRGEAATAMRDKCVDAIKSLRATPHGAAYNNAINDAISKIESLTLDQVKPGER